MSSGNRLKQIKKNRMYVPCRVCGAKHANPASSSLCSFCGVVERAKNLRNKECIKIMERELRENQGEEL